MLMKKILALSALSIPFALTACGDDVTKVYENPGMAVLESGEKLSGKTCDSSMVGEMLFVMDSSAAFVCDGKSWVPMKGADGEAGSSEAIAGCSAKKVKKGKRTGYELTCGKDVVDTLWNGSDGENGTGEAGLGCSAKTVTKKDRKGIEVTCGKDVIDTLWNGVDGEDGKAKDGSSCTAATVTKDGRSGVEITCGGTVVGTLWNGIDGEDGVGTPGEPGEPGKDGAGCKIVTGRSNEIMVIVCGEGEAADTTKLEMCKDKIYDSMHSFCDPRDGQIYKFVTIGTQTWMAQNMNFNANGSRFGIVVLAAYGRLYAKENMEEVCPNGWHLPTKEEWDLLFETVGDNYKMELTADSGWRVVQGLDSYGLSLTPAGWCSTLGKKTCNGDGDLFSYRPKGEDHVYQLSPTFTRQMDDDYVASVRCVRD